ncbi:MAG: ABC transporter permease [Actinomycetaceae bacterium]|nr:ABC transporter permease [Actinomycetaceae bacterium]
MTSTPSIKTAAQSDSHTKGSWLTVIKHHVVSEVKGQIGGVAALNLIVFPIIFLFIGQGSVGESFNNPVLAGVDVGAFIAIGAMSSLATFVLMQIMAQMYQERMNGSLLRVKMLPRGIATWAIGVTIISIVITAIMSIFMVVLSLIVIDSFQVTAKLLALSLLTFTLTVLSCVPLGFIIGALARGMWSYLISMLVFIAAVGATGLFIPIKLLYPSWAQYLCTLLPFYWAGALNRWLLLPNYPLSAEVFGAATPWLAVIVLSAWFFLGSLFAVRFVRWSLNHETIGSVVQLQSKYKEVSGL